MAAFKVNITKNGNAIKFQFTDSDHYLYGNGEVEVPVNSLSLVIDESDFVTFKKASTNDTFITFDPANSNLSDKAGVIDFYKSNMVGSTGGGSGSGMTPSEVQEMIDESVSGKADTSAVTESINAAVSGKADTTYVNQIASQATDAITALTQTVSNNYNELTGQTSDLYVQKFGDVRYDSATHRINFYAHGNSTDILAYVDASAFIKDGMVSNVEISNGNLVITFNSDAGKQPISIPLTDIFNPANYYTTAQTQSYVEGYTYDKATIDQKVAEGGTFDPDLYYDKTATDALLAAKADTATTYTKTEVDNALSSKADTSAVTAVNDALTAHTSDTGIHVSAQEKNAWNAKAEPYSAGTGIEISGNVISATGGGGATYSAGQGISIDTANTISVSEPIHAFGHNVMISENTYNPFKSITSSSFGVGSSHNFKNNIRKSVAFGESNTVNSDDCLAQGSYVTVNNIYEAGFGRRNNSVTGSTESGQTLFSVGNGTSSANHNAFEIRHNGDIYFPDTDNTTYANYYQKPMVRLQDMYGALGGIKLVKLTQAEYDALATKDSSTLYIVSNVVS